MAAVTNSTIKPLSNDATYDTAGNVVTPQTLNVAQVGNTNPYISGTNTVALNSVGNATAASGASSNITGAPTALNASLISSADQAALTKANLDKQNGLVQGQVANIIDNNSPLMRRAAAKADMQSNARGMLNSSMAVSASQGAVIDAAMPMAQADAAATNQFELTNANASNQNAQYNASNRQQAQISNQNATNATAQFNNSEKQQVAMADADAANRMGMLNTQNKQQTNLTNDNLKSSAATANAAALNDTAKNNAQLAQANDVQNVVEQNKAATVAQDATNKQLIADRANEAQIGAEANRSAATVMSTLNTAVATINASSGMTKEDKEVQIAALRTDYGNTLNVIQKLGGMNLQINGVPTMLSEILNGTAIV